ncbi:phosphodiester glycosidase family protein [Anaerosalibacter sp. Marseille-P3206]|uniref:phosphodiester glycosidase family protein n=1 Tax=Anaerosalibacter sp. Marseille-P3206 TaxID=1871005 RepID=UPI00098734D0|nr:phosphodiester glycosidase family protein [Anaerosalibacter sp. Marseille-P3206]
MQKKKVFILVLTMVLMVSQVSMAKSNSVGYEKKAVTINNQKKTVNVVTVDLNSSNVHLGVTISNDKIGGHEDFSSMIKRKKPVAAINANYFDAYKTLEPMGAILIDNKFQYLEGSPASMIVTNDGKVEIGQYKMGINGYINGFRENNWNNETQSMDYNLFKVWYVNNVPKDTSGVYIYTPARGSKIDLKGGIAIEVIENKVTKVTKNAKQASIPKNGYIIYYGNTKNFETYVDQRFKAGNTIELEYEILEAKEKPQQKQEPKANKPKPSSKQTKLYGSINKQTKNYWSNEKNGMVFNLFNVWYINTNPIDSSGVYLYTPEKGASLEVEGGHAVTVKDGKVSSIAFDVNKIDIPKNGFVIYFGKDAADKNYIEARFQVGYTVDFYEKPTLKFDTKNIIAKAVKDNAIAIEEKTTTKEEPKAIKQNNIKSIISAGPYLVENGKAIYDPNKTGFKEDKITKNRGQRSAIGITQNNKLLLVTGSNINMKELSQIMVKLGAVSAMNLDGGASSALYANGKTITPAGRKLHTVLMVYE